MRRLVEAVLTVTILYMGYLLVCTVPLGLRVARPICGESPCPAYRLAELFADTNYS